MFHKVAGESKRCQGGAEDRCKRMYGRNAGQLTNIVTGQGFGKSFKRIAQLEVSVAPAGHLVVSFKSTFRSA